jgi:putative component of toxin-antitoxin plasmid stabilization module
MASMDSVLMTVEQVVEAFGVSEPALRRWVSAGILVPVRREGHGRRLYFARGEVAALLSGVCLCCGEAFRRATLKQRFCSPACRKTYHRKKGGEHG